MRVDETEIEGSDDVIYHIAFEEEDAELYDNLVKVAENKNKTMQELIDEMFTVENLLNNFKCVTENKN